MIRSARSYRYPWSFHIECPCWLGSDRLSQEVLSQDPGDNPFRVSYGIMANYVVAFLCNNETHVMGPGVVGLDALYCKEYRAELLELHVLM